MKPTRLILTKINDNASILAQIIDDWIADGGDRLYKLSMLEIAGEV